MKGQVVKYGNWAVVSQDPDVAAPAEKEYAERMYLPILIKLWQAIEAETGYRWKCTSYWRKSPSHVTGAALDIAPDIALNSADYYAVTHKSDPVLYKRERLIRDLQRVCHSFVPDGYTAGIFIEPDHLHLQLFTNEVGQQPCRLYKWKGVKPVYPDSYQRMQLPLMR